MDNEEPSTSVLTTDDVVNLSIGAHISLIFNTAPSQPQIDHILATIRDKLDLLFEVRQRLDKGERIVFVPANGELPADEERREALVALF